MAILLPGVENNWVLKKNQVYCVNTCLHSEIDVSTMAKKLKVPILRTFTCSIPRIRAERPRRQLLHRHIRSLLEEMSCLFTLFSLTDPTQDTKNSNRSAVCAIPKQGGIEGAYDGPSSPRLGLAKRFFSTREE